MPFGVTDILAIAKSGKSNKIDVDVRNTTRHDIGLKSRTILGRLQLVQSVI